MLTLLTCRFPASRSFPLQIADEASAIEDWPELKAWAAASCWCESLQIRCPKTLKCTKLNFICVRLSIQSSDSNSLNDFVNFATVADISSPKPVISAI